MRQTRNPWRDNAPTDQNVVFVAAGQIARFVIAHLEVQCHCQIAAALGRNMMQRAGPTY